MINKKLIDPKVKRANIILKLISISALTLYVTLTYINYITFK